MLPIHHSNFKDARRKSASHELPRPFNADRDLTDFIRHDSLRPKEYFKLKYPDMKSFIGQQIVGYNEIKFEPERHRWHIASIAVDGKKGIAYATSIRCSMTNEFKTLSTPIAIEHGDYLKDANITP